MQGTRTRKINKYIFGSGYTFSKFFKANSGIQGRSNLAISALSVTFQDAQGFHGPWESRMAPLWYSEWGHDLTFWGSCREGCRAPPVGAGGLG